MRNAALLILASGAQAQAPSLPVSGPPDWSAEKKIAGFCFYDPPDAPKLAPEIEDFLERGDAAAADSIRRAIRTEPRQLHRANRCAHPYQTS